MRYARLILVAIVVSLSFVFVQGRTAHASFHCMRIHAVMAGFNGDNNVQYVELRMSLGGQTALLSKQLKFYDAAGILKATFTFPNSLPFMPVQVTGDSILIATTEFNGTTTGGAADFTFAGNTVGSNGGDPLHPVQSPDGKVTFAEGISTCVLGGPNVVDSAAYGTFTGTVDYGSAATALSSPSDNQALRLGSLSLEASDNSTEYALNAVSTTTFSVAAGSLPTDLTSPRNNSRAVLQLQLPGPTPTPTSTPDPSVGGVAELPEVAGAPLDATGSSGGSAGLLAGLATVAAGAVALGGAAWYTRRRTA